MTQPTQDDRMYSRMMAEHFGISILESDARLLHGRIQILLATAHARGMDAEREACIKLCDEADPSTLPAMLGMQIRARGQQ